MRHQTRWTPQKIQRRIELLESFVYEKREPLQPFRYKYLTSPKEPPPTSENIDDTSWSTIQPHDYWANPRTNFVLRTTFSIPPDWLSETSKLSEGDNNGKKPRSPVALNLPIGIAGDFSHPEALVYIDGNPIAACDRHHQEIILPQSVLDGKDHFLVLHGWTGIGGTSISDMTNRLKMNRCEIVQIHQLTRDFISLARAAIGIATLLKEENPVRHHLLTALDDAFKLIDFRTPQGRDFYFPILNAKTLLERGISKSGRPLDVEVAAIGHAHIDVAWLWTLGQTRLKASQTFHNVLHLMEGFPDFIFAQSQPQLYEYIRDDFPVLFDKIKTKVKEDRWELIGGMWVEADCNLSGSESLARQFLLGRTFYKNHFGKDQDSAVLWLPDVFGYAWNLPQLIKEAGLKYFFTIKIGWSQYNRLPYDSFWWQGLDGTSILTHFSTTKDPDSPFAATYNSDASPGQILGTWLNFQQKDSGVPGTIPPTLMSYGFGDGGGGPTREMLENIREMREFPGSPKVKSKKVINFFQELETQSENLPTWNGELYLEYHRGTYTTQARNKKANRESEFLLHDAEFLATYATILDEEYDYPHNSFEKAWKLVCLNQFHDIIPGSSIAEVYVESLEQYEEVKRITEEIQSTALGTISKYIGTGNFLINPTSFAQDDVIIADNMQVHTGEIPAYAIRLIPNDPTPLQNPSLVAAPTLLENDLISVEFDSKGDIVRIFDKQDQRDVLPDGMIANQFLAFEDIPLSWDAWDIDIFYDDKQWLAESASEIKVIEDGPYCSTLEINRKILNSDYTQNITLYHHSKRIDFATEIDWQERQTLLKVAFPVNILSPTATYEIQWGNVERPTHRNTSWDWARFETAAQKWVDLSEGNYGVSLINDSKYGHDIHDNIIRLTLLRGTTAPDPNADFGNHRFKYCLFPHTGRWGEETVRQAYNVNDPLILFPSNDSYGEPETLKTSIKPGNKGLPSLVKIDQSNIIIETIKLAEDRNGVILRLYEYQRGRGPFTLHSAFSIDEAWQTNILEENQVKIPVLDNRLQYEIKPYQILTLRLIPKK